MSGTLTISDLVGTYVRALNIPHITGTDNDMRDGVKRTGQIVRVERVDHLPDGTRLYAHFKTADGDPEYIYCDQYERIDVADLIGSLEAKASEFDAAIRSMRERLDESDRKFASSMDIIGARLNEQAERRDWCSEYDDIVESVNSNLPGPYLLEPRMRRFEVRWAEEYTVTVHRSATIMARNASDAEDQVSDWDEADTSELLDAVRERSYEYVSTDNIEID